MIGGELQHALGDAKHVLVFQTEDDGMTYAIAGPFDTLGEAKTAYDDLKQRGTFAPLEPGHQVVGHSFAEVDEWEGYPTPHPDGGRRIFTKYHGVGSGGDGAVHLPTP